MKRLPNWHRRLETHLASAHGRNFQWGAFDCALHACDAVNAQTGIDPGEAFRGSYASEAEAAAAMGPDLGKFAAAVAAKYGMPEIAPLHARRGDVVHVDNKTAAGALGVVDLSGTFAVCAASRGLIRVRMSRWKRAWAVPMI